MLELFGHLFNDSFTKISVFIDTDCNTSVYKGSSRISKFKSNNLNEIGEKLVTILNDLKIKSSQQIVFINGTNGHIIREYINRRGCMSVSTELIL